MKEEDWGIEYESDIFKFETIKQRGESYLMAVKSDVKVNKLVKFLSANNNTYYKRYNDIQKIGIAINKKTDVEMLVFAVSKWNSLFELIAPNGQTKYISVNVGKVEEVVLTGRVYETH